MKVFRPEIWVFPILLSACGSDPRISPYGTHEGLVNGCSGAVSQFSLNGAIKYDQAGVQAIKSKRRLRGVMLDDGSSSGCSASFALSTGGENSTLLKKGAYNMAVVSHQLQLSVSPGCAVQAKTEALAQGFVATAGEYLVHSVSPVYLASFRLSGLKALSSDAVTVEGDVAGCLVFPNPERAASESPALSP